ncbi:MAG: hypothetical protein ACOX3U_06130 [Christensenellales bacterium]|jgi:hypothetical protein
MKALKLLTALIAIITVTLTLAACPRTEEGMKSVTVIIAYDDDTADTYTKDTDLTYLGELLDELHDKGELELDCAGSDFGRQVKVIGGLQDDISEYSEWIGIYSDITDETLLFTEYKMTYGDKEYTSVNCGIDLLPLYDGRTYLFIMCESE